MKKYLITIDYELWGDGSGDVIRDVVEPTDKILTTAEEYNCRITLFYEWLEFARIQEEWDKGNKMGYSSNPVDEVKKQLIRAIKNGHDVQLHIHPQWIQAVYRDGWIADENLSRLSDYSDVKEQGLDWLVAEGKRNLESILKPVKEDYRCIAIRAGGYNADPGKIYIDCLRNNGIKVESSIYTGGRENALNQYDYSMITNNKGLWHATNDIRKENDSEQGVIELPIMALPLNKIQKYLRWSKIKNAICNIRQANQALNNKINCRQQVGFKEKIAFFIGKEYQTWDFCINSNSLQKRFIRLTNQLYSNKIRDVFTLIGHSKCLKSNPGGLHFLLHQMEKDSNSSFITVTDLYNQLCDRIAQK